MWKASVAYSFFLMPLFWLHSAVIRRPKCSAVLTCIVLSYQRFAPFNLLPCPWSICSTRKTSFRYCDFGLVSEPYSSPFSSVRSVSSRDSMTGTGETSKHRINMLFSISSRFCAFTGSALRREKIDECCLNNLGHPLKFHRTCLDSGARTPAPIAVWAEP